MVYKPIKFLREAQALFLGVGLQPKKALLLLFVVLGTIILPSVEEIGLMDHQDMPVQAQMLK
jgi:hypothetical protein